MSKYEINIGTSILSIPNVRTSQTTLNSLFAINPSTAGISYPFQVINQDGTSGNIAIMGVGHAPLNTGNANSTLVSHSYTGSDNTANYSYFGLSGTGKPALTIANNAIASLINCNTLDITPLTFGRKINLYGTPADTTTFVYDGLGIAANATVYNVSATTNNHVFYAATSSVARTELFRVAGTGAVSVPATGTFTSDGLVSANAGLNASNNSGSVPTCALTNNANALTAFVPLLTCYAPTLGAGRVAYMNIGASTARRGFLEFTRPATTEGQFTFGVVADSVENRFVMYTNPATPATLSSAFTIAGLVTANGGLSATSTTTNGINLSSNITEGIRITSSAASLNAVTLGCYATGVPDSTPIQFGFANTSGDQAKLNFSYSSANSPLNFMTLQMGAAIFKMSNSTSTASTLNTPLTVTGLVTGTNLSATTFTASRVASIDGSKNLVSTDQALLKLAASNTDYSLIGSTSPDGTTNTRIVLSANSRSGNPGEITYITTGASGAHVWWTGGATEKMRLSNAGNLTVVGAIAGNPRRGFKFQNINQTVSTSSEVILNQLNTDNNSGPLTASGSGYINNSGGLLVGLFTYSVFWDPAFGGGAVQASLIKNQVFGVPITGEKYGGSSATVFGTTYNCSCTGSAVIALNNNDDVSIWVRNNLGGNLDVKGGGAFGTNVTQLSYYILN